jgi:hypothetical protein
VPSGCGVSKNFDGDVDRALEADDEDGAGLAHLGLNILGQLERNARVAA